MQRRVLLFFGWIAWVCFVLSNYYAVPLRAIWTRRVPADFDSSAAVMPLIAVACGTLLLRHLPSLGPPRTVSWGRNVAVFGLGFVAIVTVPWSFVWPRIATALSGIGVPGAPWFGEAAGRLGIGVVGAALVVAAAVSVGAIALRAVGVRATSLTERFVFATVTGFGVVSYASLMLALLGIYRPVVVALLIAASLAAGAAAARKPDASAMPLGDLAAIGRESAPWLALAGVALAYGLVAALAPEKEYDALWYHLYLPRLWLDAGRPVDLIEEYVSLYPLTWELVFGAGLVLGGVVAAKLLHFVCLPVLGLVVWSAARRFFPGIPAAAAATLVIVTPTVLWESGTAYIDLALALHAAAACYALARYAEGGERGWMVLAALQFGLAAATKHLGVILTLVALALYAIGTARGGRGMPRAVRHALTIGVIAALVVAPWYVRSWLASGNPVFPEMFGVFGASPPDRWDALTENGLAHFKARFGMGRSAADLAALPWNVTVHGASFGGSLGPLFVLLIPGLLVARGSRRRTGWLAAAIVAYLAVWASPLSSFQLRFVVPIVPALALLAAAALQGLVGRAAEMTRYGPPAVTAAVVLLGTMNLPPFTRLHEADREGWSGWLTHVIRDAPAAVVTGRESESAYLAREVPSFGAWRAINAHAPAGARVLTTAGGDQLYAQRPRIPYDATIARSAVWAGAHELDEAVSTLRRLGITHVLFDGRELTRLAAESRAIASPAFQQACTPEYADGRFRVCRIDYSRLPPSSPARGE